MFKEMPVIPVNKVVGPKRIIGKKWRAEEEDRHKGSLTKKKDILKRGRSSTHRPPPKVCSLVVQSSGANVCC
jgi:hypothetical protein